MGKIKFKQAKPDGWFIKIFLDESGNEESRTPSWNKKGKPGYFQEMQDWIAEENEIEPYETESEKSERESKEQEQALIDQVKMCKKILNDTEYRVNNDCPYPSDLGTNKAYRAQIRSIMKSGILQDLPKDPFA